MEMATLIFSRKSLIFILALMLPFTSCKEEEEITAELKVDKNSLEIIQGKTAEINIESGNGNYTVSLSPEGIATAEIRGNTIQISATCDGQTTLTIKDAAGKCITAIIKVVSTSSVTPRFVWIADTIELEKPNNWGLTLFSDYFAITHVPDKKQYVLSWSGGLSTGPKSIGILKIIEDGKSTQSIFLTSISVAEINSLYYQIAFNQEDKKGEIVFSKDTTRK